MDKPSVLILCTANSARSQMAEALLRDKSADALDILSAGTDPAVRVNPTAVEVMREIGIDISQAQPKDLGQFLGQTHFHHVITVCHDAEGRCPTVWPGLATREHWPIEDPVAFQGDSEATLTKFREVRDELSRRLDLWLVWRDLTVR